MSSMNSYKPIVHLPKQAKPVEREASHERQGTSSRLGIALTRQLLQASSGGTGAPPMLCCLPCGGA